MFYNVSLTAVNMTYSASAAFGINLLFSWFLLGFVVQFGVCCPVLEILCLSLCCWHIHVVRPEIFLVADYVLTVKTLP